MTSGISSAGTNSIVFTSGSRFPRGVGRIEEKVLSLYSTLRSRLGKNIVLFISSLCFVYWISACDLFVRRLFIHVLLFTKYNTCQRNILSEFSYCPLFYPGQDMHCDVSSFRQFVVCVGIVVLGN